jgi:hypothetical protein
MFRPVPSLLALAVAMASAAPAAAADYDDWGGVSDMPDFRTTYATEPADWAGLGDQDDPVGFEFGLRYFYSMGSQSFTSSSPLPGDHGTMTTDDTSHIVEGHLRINDDSTNTFAKAIAGYAAKIDGNASDDAGTITVSNGNIGYLGADLGWNAFGDNRNGAGPLIGYLYWNDSPNSFSDNYTTATSSGDIAYDPVSGQTSLPGDSEVNDINAHVLRLGFSAQAELGNFIDLSAEVAAVPYAKVTGTLGAGSGFAMTHAVEYDNATGFGPTGPTGAVNVHNIQSSPTTIDGWGYGAMAQAFVGFRPADNVVFRLGGRAWYLQGTADAMFSRANIGDPTDSNPPRPPDPTDPADVGDLNPPNFDTAPTFGNGSYITRANPFSMMRYGLLAELTYKF